MRITLLAFLLLFIFNAATAQRDCDCAERLNELVNFYYSSDNPDQNDLKKGLSTKKLVIAFKKNAATASDFVVLAYLFAENDSLDQTVNSLILAAEKGMSRKKLESRKMLEIKTQLGTIVGKKSFMVLKKHT